MQILGVNFNCKSTAGEETPVKFDFEMARALKRPGQQMEHR